MRFLRHGGIYLVRWSSKKQNQTLSQNRTASRQFGSAQVKERDGRTTLTSHRPQMSSGRLFLDRVGRHQSPSPLHRHGQNNMRFPEDPGEGDISTLLGRGHFYFALTMCRRAIDYPILL